MLMFGLMVQLSAPLFIAIGPYSIKCIRVYPGTSGPVVNII